jgi:alkylation response protein AidB-like acyl-CoA dehydrogenase
MGAQLAAGQDEMPHREELLRRAVQISPILEKHRRYGELHGRLADEAFLSLREAGLLDLFKPRSLGGQEADPVTYLDVAEQVSRADSAAGWMVMVSETWFILRTASEDLIDEVSADPNTFLCVSLNKPFHAEQVEGGFQVTGATPFASGCRHADWVLHGSLVHRNGEPVLHDGVPLQLVMAEPINSVQIEDDWDTLGMRGTSSNTVCVKDVFVPEHRAFALDATNGCGSRYGGALYRCAFQTLNVTMPAVALGATRTALDTLSEIAQHKVPYQASGTLKHRQLAQVHYGRALATYRAARGYLRGAMERSWEKALRSEPFELRERADIVLAATYALEACANATREVATAAATSTIYKDCPIEHAVRDTEVLRHHGYAPEGRYGTVAQCYWDLEPDTTLVSLA